MKVHRFLPRLALALLLVAAALGTAAYRGEVNLATLDPWLGHAGGGALTGEADTVRYGLLALGLLAAVALLPRLFGRMRGSLAWIALRLTHALLKKERQTKVTAVLMADGHRGQGGPGYYNVDRMLKRVLSGNGKVLLSGTRMDARGIDDAALMAGARRSMMDQLAGATVEADKVLVFR